MTSVPSSPIPASFGQLTFEVPPFPAAGLDHPDVRAAWAKAHLSVAEARGRLQPTNLRADAEAKLGREKWYAEQRGRKPSGDLRHPVPRDRLERIKDEMKLGHAREVAKAMKTIRAIETGDVVGVERYHPFPHLVDCETFQEESVLVLVLQSKLDQEAAERRAKASRTPEEVEADEAKFIEEILAELPEKAPEPEMLDMPAPPDGPNPSAKELAAYGNALEKYLAYVARRDQIEAKRERDAATKVRTKAKREAERADPAGTAAAKREVALRKTAERQRRLRERRKAGKDRGT